MFKDWSSCLDPQTKEITLSCILVVFQNVITAAVLLAGVVALFMIVISGLRFLLSGGDPKQVEGAKSTLTWAIVGLILVILSFTILNLIGVVTGTADIITKFSFPSP